MIIDLENHKGDFCLYTPNFCQEGYCSRCQIFLKNLSSQKSAGDWLAATLQQVANKDYGFLLHSEPT